VPLPENWGNVDKTRSRLREGSGDKAGNKGRSEGGVGRCEGAGKVDKRKTEGGGSRKAKTKGTRRG